MIQPCTTDTQNFMQGIGLLAWSIAVFIFGAWCHRKGEEKQKENDYMLGGLDPDIRRAVENRDKP